MGFKKETRGRPRTLRLPTPSRPKRGLFWSRTIETVELRWIAIPLHFITMNLMGERKNNAMNIRYQILTTNHYYSHSTQRVDSTVSIVDPIRRMFVNFFLAKYS